MVLTTEATFHRPVLQRLSASQVPTPGFPENNKPGEETREMTVTLPPLPVYTAHSEHMDEPPYRAIWNLWKQGKVVPFLGAGASLACRPPGAQWNPKLPAFLPSGVDLARCLADEAEFPSLERHDREDLAKVSSYYADIVGRRPLRERLRELLNGDYQCGPLHRFLASVPAPQVIVVTNYDTLVEQAFRELGKPYDLVIFPADRKDIATSILWWRHGEEVPRKENPKTLLLDLSNTTVIYKIHGTTMRETADWDNFVITEEDYIEFLSRMTTNVAVPSLFYPYFRKRSFLFLGYSLRDWNFRVVLRNLAASARRGDDDELLPSWSIQWKPAEIDRRLWSKKNVNIFDLDLTDFVLKMQERAGV